MVDIEIQRRGYERSDTDPIWYIKLKAIERSKIWQTFAVSPGTGGLRVRSKSVCERLIVR